MTTSESDTATPPASPPTAVARGWLLGLACLTAIVWTRQMWQYANVDNIPSPPSARFVVDVNRAEVDELQALPEVGPSLSARIIEYRQEQGGFSTLEELLEVPGIGPRTLEQLRPMLTIEAQPTD